LEAVRQRLLLVASFCWTSWHGSRIYIYRLSPATVLPRTLVEQSGGRWFTVKSARFLIVLCATSSHSWPFLPDSQTGIVCCILTVFAYRYGFSCITWIFLTVGRTLVESLDSVWVALPKEMRVTKCKGVQGRTGAAELLWGLCLYEFASACPEGRFP
jgi:hypothetical protein